MPRAPHDPTGPGLSTIQRDRLVLLNKANFDLEAATNNLAAAEERLARAVDACRDVGVSWPFIGDTLEMTATWAWTKYVGRRVDKGSRNRD